MRALDRATSAEVGLPGLVMMETAGRAVAAAAQALRGARGGRIAVVCGPGNNGGDGYVVARVLRAHGVDVACYRAGDRTAVTGDAATQLAVLEKSGGRVVDIATPAGLAAIGDGITGAAVAVDALFGVGLARDITGHLAEVVAQINRARARLAVDVPSGLDADTGRTLGACVRADVTVSTGPLKIAHVSAPGFAACGRVEVCEIGVPAARIEAAATAWLVEEVDVARWLPRGTPLDHKGTRGHVLVVGGAPEMRGAGRLAAEAALRAGAGLVTLAGDGDVAAPDSIMTAGLAGGALGDRLRGKRAVVIGPGLGSSAVARARVDEVLASGVAAVLDADALNLLAADLPALAGARGPVVVTPHPGEAARLLGSTTAEVEADRVTAARGLVERTRATVVLKGARTIIAFGAAGSAPATCWIVAAGSPALGTGGSGDVLAGTIGALLAQGVPPAEAAAIAVFAHGRAGEQLAQIHGERGVVSSDLPPAIASVIATIPRLP